LYGLSCLLALLELNPLGQRQFLRVIDCAGGPLYVLLPSVGSPLAATASGFLPTEGADNLGPGSWDDNIDDDVDDAAVGALGPNPPEEFAHVLGEEGRAEKLCSATLR